MNIKEIDSAISQISGKENINKIAPCLKYPKEFYKKHKWGMKRTGGYSYAIDRRNGKFLSGLEARIINYCEEKEIEIETEKKDKLKSVKPHIPTPPDFFTDFRPDQKELISKIRQEQRGIILSPTASGKTVLTMGIISAFPEANILFLCHSIPILTQTKKELEEFGFENIGFIGAGEKELNKRITIASRSSLVKLSYEEYWDKYDIVIIDEAHHCANKTGDYAKILGSIDTTFRIGFTGSMQTNLEKVFAMEGIIGSVIGELTIKEAAELDILAKPKVKLIPVPLNKELAQLSSYKKTYDACIINNRLRNTLIVKEVKKQNKKNKSVLIMVKNIEHGEQIIKIAKMHNVNIEYILGNTDNFKREKVKDSLENKKVKAVMATAIWKEGVNIKSLDCVIRAAGGKSDIESIQIPGRGLRKTKDKDTVLIVDFLDPYKWLAQHTVERIAVYAKQGWI